MDQYDLFALMVLAMMACGTVFGVYMSGNKEIRARMALAFGTVCMVIFALASTMYTAVVVVVSVIVSIVKKMTDDD